MPLNKPTNLSLNMSPACYILYSIRFIMYPINFNCHLLIPRRSALITTEYVFEYIENMEKGLNIISEILLESSGNSLTRFKFSNLRICRELKFLAQIMRKDSLEHAILTGYIESRKYRGDQRITYPTTLF